jgi:hypothetical protein|uniref:C2H2-type domain-containing protein n=1 Tax=viral metagenome TaxID=1070528 RepID=A0A6C0IRT3_9ZZZZ
MATDFTTKNPKQLVCIDCDFQSSNQKDYNRHCLTAKHNLATGRNTKTPNSCIKCNKTYISRSGLWRHSKICNVTSDENILLPNRNNPQQSATSENVEKYECKNCKKNLHSRSGLWRHKQTCSTTVQVNNIDKELINTILYQHHDLMSAVNNGKIGNTVNNINNSNNSNNTVNNIHNSNNNTVNNFNLNLFLNTTCKDALNINEFIDTLRLQLKDLEETGRLGHVNGITRIVLNALQDIDITERPFHCTDKKREVVYIKDDDKWTKDESKVKLKSAIETISNKNSQQLAHWCEENPNSLQMGTQENKLLTELTLNSLGPESNDDFNKDTEKIAKNIMKNIMIEKE